MSYSKVVTTKKGERYLQDLIISGEPLTFTKIVTSTRNYTKEDAKNRFYETEKCLRRGYGGF